MRLACSFDIHAGALETVQDRPSTLIGIPYDRPVVGYGGKTINTLRLWSAATPDYFDFQQFSGGDFVGALAETLTAETLTRVLYPDDSTTEGKGLRFLQQYFLVACTLADAIRRFRAAGNDWSDAAGQGRDAAQRHAPDARGPRADAHPPDDATLDGTKPGISRSARSLTPTTHCCQKPSRNGRCHGSRCCCRGSSKSFTKSTGASWTTSAQVFPATTDGLRA